ncbi:uncharacterized protein LOC132291258 [Cornus florida]|uniref:uncharacterized protein LOC132291258 n=1 Tax=Cornus florida TaxID=4283 RepID=UPI00289F5A22|nr:uncharacterized protein LOC132291258 [Cornus florida]
MMDNWRRKRGDNYCQESAKTRSQNKKPPLGSWQPTVPSWEKKFCTSVGSVPWCKLLETKKFMYLYDNVVKWNDSAGEEAFYNAKNRFWAEINGLPCDISLPDPNIYIDEIDWNSNIDPELLLDLEREYVIPDGGEKDEKVVIFGKQLLSNQSFSCTGWGEEEDDLKKATNSSLDNNKNLLALNCTHDVGAGAVRENGWGDVCDDEAMKDSGWGDGWNNSQSLNQWENNNNESQNLKDSTDRVWGTQDVNNGMSEGSVRYMSRYKTLRFHGNEHQRSREWRNGKVRKRANFVYERPFSDKRPASKQWT